MICIYRDSRKDTDAAAGRNWGETVPRRSLTVRNVLRCLLLCMEADPCSVYGAKKESKRGFMIFIVIIE
jgi:hypothetical protein